MTALQVEAQAQPQAASRRFAGDLIARDSDNFQWGEGAAPNFGEARLRRVRDAAPLIDRRSGNRAARRAAVRLHQRPVPACALHLGLLLQHSSAVCELVHTLSRHRHAYYYTRQTASQVEGRAMSLLLPRVDSRLDYVLPETWRRPR